MDSDFYILLKNVGFRNKQYDSVIIKLEKALKKAVNYIKDNEIENPETLKTWVKYSYFEITNEQLRIEKTFRDLQTEVTKSEIKKNEYKQISVELNSLHEILHLTDELRGRLLEYFAAYHPNVIFNSTKLVDQLKMLTPFSEVTRHFLWSVKKNEEKSTPFNSEFDGMYAVSQVKEIFSTKSLKSITHLNKTIEIHKYELRNQNIYDENTEELLKVACQADYDLEFELKICDMNPLDIHSFLDYQLAISTKKNELIRTIKYKVIYYKSIKFEGIKEAIKNWLTHQESGQVNKSTTRENPVNSTPEKNESELFLKIKKHFGFMLGNSTRNNKPILGKDDLNKLIQWTTHFFENDFMLPEIKEPIKFVNVQKYITQIAFQVLFDELRATEFHDHIVKSNTSLFSLWKSCFQEYKGDKEPNFYKVRKTGKNQRDFNQEVKKMMLIK